MPKLKQFSNVFDVAFSKENNPWIGEAQCLTSSGTLFLRDLGQESFIEIRRGNSETKYDWLRGRGFPNRASRSYSLG